MTARGVNCPLDRVTLGLPVPPEALKILPVKDVPNTKNVPIFVIHYSRSEPFRSMTSVPSDKWPQTVKELDETNAWGVARFSDPEYLVRRLEIERRVRNEFIQKGGKPGLENPIYFFLGRQDRFEKHERNMGYMIYLDDISADLISFTYGDSLLSFDEDYRTQSGEKYQNPLCGKVYRLDELEYLFSHVQFPENAPLSIEAQLWIIPPKEIVRSLAR